jgi:hypothetical protein
LINKLKVFGFSQAFLCVLCGFIFAEVLWIFYELFLDLTHLGKSPHVPLRVRKRCGKECADEFFRQFAAYHSRAETEYIHIVIFNALASGKGVMTNSCSDSGELVRCNACTHAATADQDPPVSHVPAHGPGNGTGSVRVVHGFNAECAQIEGTLSGLREIGYQLRLEQESTVISSDSDLHCFMALPVFV